MTWTTPRANLSLMIGGGITALLLITTITSCFYTPYSPIQQDITSKFQPPSKTHPMGTDHLGRDTLSRLMEGARYSLFVASAAVTIGMGIGTVVGFAAGVSPSWIDETLMRGIDLMMGFPVILLAVLIMGVFGPGIRNGMIAIGLANIPIFARLTRGSLLSLKEEEFVLAARACGAGTQRIVLAHLLPNLVPILIVQGTLSLGTAILADAGLSYLGLGVRLPHASWGRMLYDARSALLLGFGTWLVIFPGIAIALTILGFNLLGDGLRDRIDPRRARRHLKKTRRGVSSR